jgi:hypothetical protein
MNALASRLFILNLSTALLAGCQTTQPGPSASNPEPKIVSALRSGGKGIPNGRSDSTAPYFRTLKLPVATDPGYGYGYSATKPIQTGPRDKRNHEITGELANTQNDTNIQNERGAC